MSDSELLDAYYAMSEDVREKLDDELWSAMPLHWQGQDVVDLDNLGDGRAWMEEHLGETPTQSLLDGAENLSGVLAQDYAAEIEEQGHSLPSDFDDEGKMETLDDLAMVQADFRRFLAAWRERAVPLVRKFVASGSGPATS